MATLNSFLGNVWLCGLQATAFSPFPLLVFLWFSALFLTLFQTPVSSLFCRGPNTFLEPQILDLTVCVFSL